MTKRTARKNAEALGHELGNFKARYHSNQPAYGTYGQKMYDVAWCRLCGHTFFVPDRPDRVTGQCVGEGAGALARQS